MSPTTQDYVTVAGNGAEATNFSMQPNAGDALYNSYVAMGVEPINAAAMAQQAVPSFVPPPEASAPALYNASNYDYSTQAQQERIAAGQANGSGSGDSGIGGMPQLPGVGGGGGGGGGMPPAGGMPGMPGAPAAVGGGMPGAAVGGAQPGVGGTGTAGMNVPYGADFFQPMMQYLLGMLGIGTQNKQFNADQLASMQANPYSAAELAFRRSGQGLSPFSTGKTNASDVRDIIASPTSQGMPGGNVADFGNGQTFNIPDTLSGGQLSDLQGMPGSQGVLESIARAGGNPDIIARSLKALMPSMFGGTGTGLA